jgi:hypothetical protein
MVRDFERSVGYDWEDLFARWARSGLKKNEFLKKEGINPNGMIAKRKTEGWYVDVTKASRILRGQSKEDEVETVLKAMDAKDDPLPPGNALKEIWQIVQTWRQKQSEHDYRLADVIRLHCKVLLKNSLSSKMNKDGSETMISNLKPNDLLSIARIAETVQRVQRLALGLSTENIGVDRGIEVDNNENVPIFEVQMSENGKFVNVR